MCRVAAGSFVQLSSGAVDDSELRIPSPCGRYAQSFLPPQRRRGPLRRLLSALRALWRSTASPLPGQRTWTPARRS